MEVEEIQAHQQPCKFPRVGNGGRGSSAPDEEDNKRDVGTTTNRLNGWHHSRIIRVSRASGGKDRHSKVWTSKGLRDRRVRLSVSTSIQFYDLQDRLGYDQPSKAVEWLIKAAADAIAELPSLNASFPDTPKQLRGSSELAMDGDNPNYHHQMKPACSSNSETSKGSGLSLKARERAAAKEKEPNYNNNHESSRVAQAISQNGSFTELLTGHQSNHHQRNVEHVLFHKPQQMDYSIGSSLLGLSSTPARNNQHQFSGNSLPQTLFSISGDHRSSSHPEMQNFSFVPDYNPVSVAANGGDYNLNFSMSMSSSGGLAGFNGGTLQSNSSPSPSILPHLQRFSPIESNVPFFLGASTAPTMENHHQFPAGLQLYGDGSRHSDHKGKAKN